jgi:hypothetical protein
MLVLLWVRSLRLYITDYPALLLTASLVPLHGSAFIFYASLVLSSAIQWAVIGLLFRAIFQKISNDFIIKRGCCRRFVRLFLRPAYSAFILDQERAPTHGSTRARCASPS